MTKSEKKRLTYLIAGLVFVSCLFLADQIGLLDDSLTESAGNAQRVAPLSGRSQNRAPNPRSTRERDDVEDVDRSAGYEPLPLEALEAAEEIGEGAERNIFVYYVPPKPTIEPPPPEPPPLTLHSIEPASVYAGTGSFRLRVSGADFPEDAQIIVNGRRLETRRASESELTAVISEHLIATPGQLRVEVKDATGQLYSDGRSIAIRAPDEPRYEFLGRLDNRVYLRRQGEDKRLVVKVGETLRDRWRVADVGDRNVVLQDALIGIEHTLKLVDPAPIRAAPIRRTPVRTRTVPRRTTNPARTIRPRPQPQPRNQNQRTRP